MTQPTSPGHKFATLYDTAKKCLLILDELYSEPQLRLSKITEPDDAKAKSALAVRIYIDAFSIIDFSHRFMQIVDAMSLLSKKGHGSKKASRRHEDS